MSARIVRVEVGRYDYPVVGEFKFFKPGPDGRTVRPSVLVRLTDEDGCAGWGQSVPIPTWTYETPETVVSSLAAYLAPAILGGDPEDIDELHARMDVAIKPAFSVGQPLCKAAVDLAAYDLVGRRRGMTVRALLPGAERQEAVTVSWTAASPDMASIEAQLEAGRARGFRNFNIKVGAPQTPHYDVALAKAVRAFSPDGFLWADANTGYDTESALAVAPRLADAGVDVLESPLPPNVISGYQALRKLGALPVLMDEGILSAVEAREFLALGMMDGIAMKPSRNAGIRASWQIIRMLRDEGKMVLGSGLTDPDLSLAAAVHLYSAAGIQFPCALNGRQLLEGWLCGDALVLEGDRIRVPTGPGLGITLDARAESVLEVVAES